MFWRIVRRLLTSNYSRLFVILLALGAGAAITSALLNLQIDAKRRLTTEFRSLGANVIIAPRSAGNGGSSTSSSADETDARQNPSPMNLELVRRVWSRGYPWAPREAMVISK